MELLNNFLTKKALRHYPEFDAEQQGNIQIAFVNFLLDEYHLNFEDENECRMFLTEMLYSKLEDLQVEEEYELCSLLKDTLGNLEYIHLK